jgi:hypothetical protein
MSIHQRRSQDHLDLRRHHRDHERNNLPQPRSIGLNWRFMDSAHLDSDVMLGEVLEEVVNANRCRAVEIRDACSVPVGMSYSGCATRQLGLAAQSAISAPRPGHVSRRLHAKAEPATATQVRCFVPSGSLTRGAGWCKYRGCRCRQAEDLWGAKSAEGPAHVWRSRSAGGREARGAAAARVCRDAG